MTLLPSRALVAFVLALPLAGCSCGGNLMVHHDGGEGDAGPIVPGIDGLVSIAVTPADATLRISPTASTTQAYTAMGTFRDHHVEDITSRVGFFISGTDTGAGLGSFAMAQYRSGTRGGHTTVYARAGDITGMTGLTLVMAATVLVPPTPGSGAPALPAMPSSLFGGPADTTSPPALVYPNDGVVLPPNLGRIEIHWLVGAASNTLFEVAFTNAATDVRAYMRCERPAGVRSDGCIWEAASDAWTYVARTNAGGDPVTITVRGTTDSGGPVGTSMTRTMRFSYDNLNGAIYYWTTSGGTSVNRYDFGAPAGTPPMPVLYPSQTPDGACVGCHALSHDGKKIAASTNGIDNGGFMLVDLVSSAILVNRPAGDHVMQFMSFAPDGNTLVAVYGDNGAAARRYQLMMFDTTCTTATMSTCGQQTTFIDLGAAEPSHPSWSPDGQHIAYTEVGMHNHTQRPQWGAVRVVDAMGAGWSAPRDLAPRVAGINRYNPDFAPVPLSTFVLYDESICPGGDILNDDCDADADPPSKVWAVPIAGGTPVLLAAAMAPGTMDMGTTDLQATFPRFAPFVFTLSNGDLGPTSLMWFTFASRRAYGLRSPSSVGGSASWLWMAAVLPDQVGIGADPSLPAFALPFQALDTSNHIAVWTTVSVGDGMLH